MNENPNEEVIVDLVHQIRVRAGEIGLEIHGESHTGSEANYYDYLVQDGLANAVLDILGNDWQRFLTWLVGCICNHNLGGDAQHLPLLLAVDISTPANEMTFGQDPNSVREDAIARLNQWILENPIRNKPRDLA